jgi:hypothetical protein
MRVKILYIEKKISWENGLTENFNVLQLHKLAIGLSENRLIYRQDQVARLSNTQN